ncbi:MAG TPA: tRNA adenosine(34) deaminase TadA [Bryobacteraceae bacterium]|jgi:tRNA(adenine34) deaminase|nr:tRNA adenosine(34) deaminase TadA [Bryobacteraceae bacterium]
MRTTLDPGVKWSDADQTFMRRALDLAQRAAMTEVPVGAVLVRDGQVLGEGWNHPISSNDPSSHAEIEALRQAAQRNQNYRLPGSTLYVTLEPCVMCAGAIVLARVKRVVFAARDIRFGALRSKFRLADSALLNHQAMVEEGLLAAEAGELVLNFFGERRLRE